MLSKKLIFIIVFIISALTLQLEFLQTRILSFVLWHHFVYIVITMALLGFAASGTILSISSKLRRLSDSRFYFLCLMGFSLTSYFASKFAFYPIRNIFSLSPDTKTIFGLIITYTISMVPYFFAGLAIVGSFLRFSEITGILYFVNLLGSGFGCLLFILLIGYLGAPLLLLVTSLVCIIPLMAIVKNSKRTQIFIMPWLIFLVIGLFLRENSMVHQIIPESHKQYWTIFGENTKLEYSEWNPVSRTDVISNAKYPREKYILMDGDAAAHLFDVETVKYYSERSKIDRNAAYVLLDKRPERVLVIGAGGGFDVILAVLRGSHRIDAVEINPTSARLASKVYSAHLSHIFSNPEVNLIVEDGRSFVKRSKEKYDVIMMYATDSLLALSTGAYVLLDNYLYTKDAFLDYLGHLSEDGFIQIGRWFYSKKPRETLRIFSTALEACRDNGYKNPSSHIAVVASGDWGNVIVKKSPFSKEEKERLLHFCSRYNIKILFPTDYLYPYTEQTELSPFVQLANYFSKGIEDSFYNEYLFNITPVSDDSPFFYQYNKWQSAPDKKSIHTYYDKIRGIWHIFVLTSLLLHAVILSFIFVLLPLIIFKKKLGGSRINIFTFIYFLSIGSAFMLMEMAVVQKFVLFLGHPIYSMAIVIPTILICAGLGSLFSHQIKGDIRINICIITLICGSLIFLIRYFIPNISNLFLLQPQYVRIGAVIIAIAPLAFCMGFPFPFAIRAVSAYSQENIPWAWAINSSFSVIASIIAVIIAMQFGFGMVLNVSAIFYIIAALSALFLLINSTSFDRR